MTGPTTAAELVDLAVAELHELQRRARTPTAAATAPELAAGWPAFSRSAQRLITALHNDPGGQGGGTSPPGPQASTGAPDRNLQRAADYLGAAADLLDTRDRRSLTAQQRAAEAAQITPHLAAAGYLVAAVTAAYPALLDTAADVTVAVRSWRPSPSTEAPAVAAVSSLVDASTVASALRQSASPRAVSPDATSPALAAVHAALNVWQQAAVAVARAPAPSQSDLLGAARTAGMLTRLAQNLISAHADPTRAGDATAAASQQLRRSGATWNAAAEVWRTIATGGRTLSPDVRAAGAALEAAVRAFARTGADWTSPQDLRAKASPDLALQLARTVLAATQSVAEQHAPLVARLGQTAALYTQARHLPVPETAEEPEQHVTDRLTGRFAPIGPGDAAPLVAGYQRLPAAAAAARTACATLTDPAAAPNPGCSRAAGHTEQPAVGGPQQPREPLEQTGAIPVTLAGQRWQQTLADLDARLLDDPHYPALAAPLDRIQLAGVDVPASLAAAANQPLPDEHTARALHWHLVDVCPAAITPYTDTTGPSRPAAQPAALAAAAAVQRPTPTARTARR